ncbi:MAG: tRNA/tmRNA/rRNA uracil-C5-methylase [Arachnia propionica]|nr:MAG: tRNA/tmRNA/rRNA uracil-C5-methylase [Arachnia propionica]
MKVGEVVQVELDRVAHGGWCVGRVAGKVHFVAGGIPGELVAVKITSIAKGFNRAQVQQVISASPDRIAAPCPIVTDCGGCAWQHVAGPRQRQLKAAVIAEQLQRLAGIDWDGPVEEVTPVFGWRTRMDYATDDQGNLGFHRRRSSDIVALPSQGCLIAGHEQLAASWPEAASVRVFRGAETTVVVDGKVRQGPRQVQFRVAERDYLVDAQGFWQPHTAAAEQLVAAVLAGLQVRAGESVADLYCGVGLFAGALASHDARVVGLEGNRRAVELARRNVPEAEFQVASLPKQAARIPKSTDVVVLDPPRSGAGKAVVARIAAAGPRAVAYVACDPAALARDLAHFQRLGYGLDGLSAYDLFPQTHHVECVALLSPRRSTPTGVPTENGA